MSKVGFDLDGCVYDFHRALYTELQIYENLTESFEEFWTTTYKTYKNDMWWENIVQLKHLYGTQPPERGVVDFIKDVATRNEVYYITTRPTTVKDATINWLTRFDFPSIENLYIGKGKEETAKRLGIDIFIEDRIHHAVQLKEFCKVYVVKRPYNLNDLEGYNVIASVLDLKGVL